MQEILGELATGIGFYSLGFEPTGIHATGVHGPDFIALNESLNLVGIFEAKGGTARLSSSINVNGRTYKEMSKGWIQHYIGNLSENGDGQRVLLPRIDDTMIAVVTRINIERKRSDVQIGMQLYNSGFRELKDWVGFK